MTQVNTGLQSEKGAGQDWKVAIVVIIGSFMSILDTTIVNVGLPVIMEDFHSSAEMAQWMLTAYLLSMGIFMPLTAYLGDRFGYKRVYALSLLFFIAGSAFCGLAWSMDSIIIARVLQAVGGGIIQPVGLALLYQNYPRERMGMMMGVYGIAVAVAPAIGPVLGGVLVQFLDWRWIFFINVPIGVLNIVLIHLFLQETQLVKGQRLDWGGLVLPGAFLFCFLLALNQGSAWGWGSPAILGLLAAAGLALLAFIYIELHQADPILDVRIFLIPAFTWGVVAIAFVSVMFFSSGFLFSMLLQSTLQVTPTVAGLTLFPAAIMTGLLMPVAGKFYDKHGLKIIGSAGIAIAVLASIALAFVRIEIALVFFALVLGIRGIGVGLSFMPLMTATLNAVPAEQSSKASTAVTVVRQAAMATGITLLTLVQQKLQPLYYSRDLAHGKEAASGYLEMFHQLTSSGMTGTWDYQPFAALAARAVTGVYAKLAMLQSFGACMYFCAITAIVGGIALLMIKEDPAQRGHGAQSFDIG